jgi:dTDP-glucose pyrophosphorylase
MATDLPAYEANGLVRRIRNAWATYQRRAEAYVDARRRLLAYLLGNLRRHGFSNVAINLQFKPEAIQSHFGDGSRWQMQLNYSHEPQLLGTAGGVKNLEGFFRSEEAFLVHYGDVLTDQDLSALIEFHRHNHALATSWCTNARRSNSVVTLDASNRIIGFLERPADSSEGPTSLPGSTRGLRLSPRSSITSPRHRVRLAARYFHGISEDSPFSSPFR